MHPYEKIHKGCIECYFIKDSTTKTNKDIYKYFINDLFNSIDCEWKVDLYEEWPENIVFIGNLEYFHTDTKISSEKIESLEKVKKYLNCINNKNTICKLIIFK